MSIQVLEKIQPEVSLILEHQPNLKQEVQKTLREVVETTPQFESIDELLDWKIDVWEKQLEVDTRVQALWNVLSDDEIENFYDTIILNPYIPVVPYLSQLLLLFSRGSVLFGGARGGGKSEACLIGALQYVDFPEYKAGIFRLTYPDLSMPGAIMDRALTWLKDNPLLEKEGIAPKWDSKTKTFTFPSGAKVMFGHVQHETDVGKYQGPEFHLLIIDEAVQFSVNKITKLKGSNRKTFDSHIPLRIWYTGNPGGLSHDFFKVNFIDNFTNFIDSKYTDNPYLNQEAYESIFEDIEESDPILYRQWKYGDWEAVPEGLMFKRPWFTKRTYDGLPPERIIKRVRFWDMAATYEEDPNKQGGADWTVGVLLLLGESGKAYIDDVQFFREDPAETERLILEQAEEDTREVILRVEQEGGSQAKMYVHNTLARMLPGYDFEGRSSRKDKIDRAKSMVSFIKSGNMEMKENPIWNTFFLNLVCSFPTKGIHDDPVDATSGAYMTLFDLTDKDIVIKEHIDYDAFNKLNEF